MYDAALERVKPRYHEELYAFGQAVAADSSNVERIAEARHALEKAGGQDLVVEAAATIALFEFATRCTDSSGAEPLDSMTESMMRMYLGAGAIGRFRVPILLGVAALVVGSVVALIQRVSKKKP
mmetsp:Transcript_35254/g.68586  ORF Transcript_35254/g.68586 Transcript_35254/m.68586 type:complete len:124 (+) Transcript_35254:910-1281(+)